MNGLKRCESRDQRYDEEGNTAKTTVLVSGTGRVYVYGQRVSFGLLPRSHRVGGARTPGMGTPSGSG